MRIALLSGAVKNAGDFLITQRAKELLEDVFPKAEISVYIRNLKLTLSQVKEIRGMDVIVLAGGPCYKWDLYPQSIPLVDDLSDLKPPMFILGGGWYGNTTSSAEIWNYKFSESSKKLLERVQNDTNILGCRDYYAIKVLRANGLKTGLMTGCPAWYDIARIDKRLYFPQEIKKIAISDPADVFHFGAQSLDIARLLRRKFPKAEIVYLFHRGIKADAYTDARTAERINSLRRNLREIQIPSFDIAYSDKGFEKYDDCDLHVGHRVHAHIYNLSQRHCSILIEEDARGAGVNEALGLWSIKAYSRKKEIQSSLIVKAYNKLLDFTKLNSYCIEEVNSYIDYLMATRANIMNLAFSNMENYYGVMRSHIASLEKYI